MTGQLATRVGAVGKDSQIWLPAARRLPLALRRFPDDLESVREPILGLGDAHPEGPGGRFEAHSNVRMPGHPPNRRACEFGEVSAPTPMSAA